MNADVLAAALRILPTQLPSNHCILRTRVGIEVLAAFDVPVTPISVSAHAGTDAYWAWANTGNLDDLVGPPPPYSVAVVQGRGRPGRWPGHLVGRLADDTLADFDLQAFQRPAHALMPPAAAQIPRDAEGDGWVLMWPGGGIAYLAHPDDRSYRRAPDWIREWRPYVGPAIRAMRTHLRAVNPLSQGA
jgi:hypothetical protein